jgi:hypothetical protein
LTWKDNSTNETGFRIERRFRGETWQPPYTTVGANVVTYTDTATIWNVVYEYRIFATNASGSSASSNVIEVTIPSYSPLAAAASITTKTTTKKTTNSALPT